MTEEKKIIGVGLDIKKILDARNLAEPEPELPKQGDTTTVKSLPVAYNGPTEARENIKNALVAYAKATNPDVTEESLAIIKTFIDRNSRGSSTTLPMICKGLSCPFLNVCSLYQAGVELPVGKSCPLESSLVYLWVNKHLKALGIEDIDSPENSFDMDMLYELAAQELIKYRCSAYLSKNPELVENKIVGESFQGTPIFADVITPILEVMDRAGKNINKIRDALLATRKSQIDAGQIIVDATQKAAELREKARQINKMRQQQLNVIKEADFKVKDNEKPIQ